MGLLQDPRARRPSKGTAPVKPRKVKGTAPLAHRFWGRLGEVAWDAASTGSGLSGTQRPQPWHRIRVILPWQRFLRCVFQLVPKTRHCRRCAAPRVFSSTSRSRRLIRLPREVRSAWLALTITASGSTRLGGPAVACGLTGRELPPRSVSVCMYVCVCVSPSKAAQVQDQVQEIDQTLTRGFRYNQFFRIFDSTSSSSSISVSAQTTTSTTTSSATESNSSRCRQKLSQRPKIVTTPSSFPIELEFKSAYQTCTVTEAFVYSTFRSPAMSRDAAQQLHTSWNFFQHS